MAALSLNICKFDGCSLIFQTIQDLILHIEDMHIDKDPVRLRQRELEKASNLPLSYILKYYTNPAKRQQQILDIKRRINENRYFAKDKYDIDSDDSSNSNNSWTLPEEYSSKFILKYGTRATSSPTGSQSEKPFRCPVPGCKKRYKNVNGIKYHSKNGHKKDKIKKKYRCECGKKYKSFDRLQYHFRRNHNTWQESKRFLPFDFAESPGSYAQIIPKEEVDENENLWVDVPVICDAIQEEDETAKYEDTIIKQEIRDSDCGTAYSNDLGILTPATSPDSNHGFSNIHSEKLLNPFALNVKNFPKTFNVTCDN